jgi:catechol 2,3-dioxygenase-like lactoylglutathione lyase family enzyme
MNTADGTIATGQEALSRQPRFSGLSHVSLACRDLVESKQFYSEVLGGELVHEIAGFVEYRIADVIFGLSEQSQGWTAPDHEYPHYAFYLDGLNFDRMIRWLDDHGVRITPIDATRPRSCIFAIRPAICSSSIVIAATKKLPLCRRRRDEAGHRSILAVSTIAGSKMTVRRIQAQQKTPSSAGSRMQAFTAAISRRPKDFSQGLSAAS